MIISIHLFCVSSLLINKPSYPVSRTIYWEELLFFSIKDLLSEHLNAAEKENHSRNLSLNIENSARPDSKSIQTKLKAPSKAMNREEFLKTLKKNKNEIVNFAIYEFYDQGAEILICTHKMQISELVKKTTRFLFDITFKQKVLGKLKIGNLYKKSLTSFFHHCLTKRNKY